MRLTRRAQGVADSKIGIADAAIDLQLTKNSFIEFIKFHKNALK
jgi:hypothetical protein